MARPSKPAQLISIEHKSHRTKKELAHRKEQEAKTLSGHVIKEAAEVKGDALAHKIFQTTKKMLKAIGKDDILYGAVINRYCKISAEVCRLESTRQTAEQTLEEIRESRSDYEDVKEYAEAIKDYTILILNIDKDLKAKRQQLFAIEKESCMTISSALRSIPKQPETKTNALKEALGV